MTRTPLARASSISSTPRAARASMLPSRTRGDADRHESASTLEAPARGATSARIAKATGILHIRLASPTHARAPFKCNVAQSFAFARAACESFWPPRALRRGDEIHTHPAWHPAPPGRPRPRERPRPRHGARHAERGLPEDAHDVGLGQPDPAAWLHGVPGVLHRARGRAP